MNDILDTSHTVNNDLVFSFHLKVHLFANNKLVLFKQHRNHAFKTMQTALNVYNFLEILAGSWTLK